ncbi:MAG: Zn-dependent hydrolase of the beta-lactamase fold-like protein [uncultured bacterium]|nr:MAG: Zn-dependent hydrolase of the beta-lactamase fold-like protein [uncultured bacterium]HBR71223.1 MBL fold metallo-hydrolase [Candidatus Moranbacteria bacterium]
MNIQYYGHSCFKFTVKPAGRATEDITLFVDPFDKEAGLRPPQGQADVILVSHNHRDHSNISALKGEPIVIENPGEYSVKGINVVGLDSFHDDKEGAERGKNTIFIFETEGLKICHLGDLGCDLSPKQMDEIYGTDILLIPVGGKYTIDGKKAAEIVRKVEPIIVIPMHYKMPESNIDINDEKDFCDAMGSCPKQKVSKLNIKKKDLEEKKLEVILMENE